MSDLGILYGYASTRQTVAWVFTSNGTTFDSPTAWWNSGPNNWDWNGSKLTSGDYGGYSISDMVILYYYKNTKESALYKLKSS